MHDQRRWLALPRARGRGRPTSRERDVFCSALPAPFGFGIWTAHVTPTLLGAPTRAAAALRRRGAAARAIARHRVTVLAAVSTQFILMLDALDARARAPRPLLAARALHGRRGGALRARGARSRSAPARACSSSTARTRPARSRAPRCATRATCACARAGHVIPEMQVRLFDDERPRRHRDAAAASRAAAARSRARGYWDDAAANAQLFTADGWMLTGDIAEIDADGVLRVVGPHGRLHHPRRQERQRAGGRGGRDDAPRRRARGGRARCPTRCSASASASYVELQPGRALTLDELVAHLRAQGVSVESLPGAPRRARRAAALVRRQDREGRAARGRRARGSRAEESDDERRSHHALRPDADPAGRGADRPGSRPARCAIGVEYRLLNDAIAAAAERRPRAGSAGDAAAASRRRSTTAASRSTCSARGGERAGVPALRLLRRGSPLPLRLVARDEQRDAAPRPDRGRRSARVGARAHPHAAAADARARGRRGPRRARRSAPRSSACCRASRRPPTARATSSDAGAVLRVGARVGSVDAARADAARAARPPGGRRRRALHRDDPGLPHVLPRLREGHRRRRSRGALRGRRRASTSTTWCCARGARSPRRAAPRALGHAPVVVEPARREHARPRHRAPAAPALRAPRRVSASTSRCSTRAAASRRSRSSTPSCARWRAARSTRSTPRSTSPTPTA